MMSRRLSGWPALSVLPVPVVSRYRSGLAGYEPVVRGVVQAAKTERRPVRVALGRVVEHDVEHDLESSTVQGVDHGPELIDQALGVARRTAAE